MKKRIAFIVQRYGLEVNGGAEYHCRLLAERLTAIYDVDILTTCAIEYKEWANHYPAGVGDVNGIRVLRFPTLQNRNEKGTSSASHKLTRKPPPNQKKWLTFVEKWGRILQGKTVKRYIHLWAKYQGPYVPGLLAYIKKNQEQYDVLIFFTYLYYPTIEGIKLVPHKSILIPTAHDEPPIYLPVFRNLFSLPKAILYNSSSEKRFVNRTFHNESLYSDIVGVGVEPIRVPTAVSVTSLLGTAAPYLIYIGRIDTAKACDVLFEYFSRYKENVPSPLKLVLVGQAFMPIPDHPDILPVGFVDEAVKIALLQGAKALVIPSFYESLSMVTLESFAYGIPVIANAHCDVLSDHIDQSKAGFLYGDYPDFEQAVQQVVSRDLREMATSAQTYVEQNYTWDKVLIKFTKAVEYVTGT